MALSQKEFEKLGVFYLGSNANNDAVLYDSRDLLTHAICVGMTGSGKTGLGIGILEEAILDAVPAIIIDPKGDMGNLLLAFPELQGKDFLPWVDADEARRKNLSLETLADKKSALWKDGLEKSGQDSARISRFKTQADFTIYTPGSTSGIPISILSSLKVPPLDIVEEPEFLAEQVAGTVGSILGLLGIATDNQSPAFVFVSNLVRHFWLKQESLDLGKLIDSILHPPISKIGYMDLDTIFEPKKRIELAKKINNLIASPGFTSWMQGDDLNIPALLFTEEGKPRVSIFSISHLDDQERMFFVSLLLNQLTSWMRTQSGTTSLRALLYMDEIFGYLPPVANPPSKKPLLTLLKQARAYGIGLILATQNPADIDYKALSNAGTWFIGRLQTPQDRDRVIDGLLTHGNTQFSNRKTIESTLANLESRAFLLHNVHESEPIIFNTRWVMSYLKGPLTRKDIRALMEEKKKVKNKENAPHIKDKNQALQTKSLDIIAQSITPEEITSERPSQPAMSPTHAIRPLLESVPQLFMKASIPSPGPDYTLSYRPMLYGWGNAFFDDAKYELDQSIRFGLIHGLHFNPLIFNWKKAFRVDLDPSNFRSDPIENSHFLELPKDAKKKTSYTKWSRTLVDHIYHEETTEVWRCSSLRLKSLGTEIKSDFVQRVHDVLRERRDDTLDKIRDRYQKKMEASERRLQSAEHQLETQEDQARSASLDSALTIGTSIFGAFFGRKSSRSMATAARRGSRAIKEKRDVARAEEKYQSAVENIEKINFESEEKLREAAEKFAFEMHPIESVAVSVKKKNIKVEWFGLTWVPYWISDSEKVLAVSY